jgi:hypothetical protein
MEINIPNNYPLSKSKSYPSSPLSPRCQKIISEEQKFKPLEIDKNIISSIANYKKNETNK